MKSPSNGKRRRFKSFWIPLFFLSYWHGTFRILISECCTIVSSGSSLICWDLRPWSFKELNTFKRPAHANGRRRHSAKLNLTSVFRLGVWALVVNTQHIWQCWLQWFVLLLSAQSTLPGSTNFVKVAFYSRAPQSPQPLWGYLCIELWWDWDTLCKLFLTDPKPLERDQEQSRLL